MATFGSTVETRTFVAGEDLSAAQYLFVTLETDGEVDLADAIGEDCYGVLMNDPDVGEAATVAIRGVVMMEAAGDVAVGDKICTNAAGEALDVNDSNSATTRHMGIALDAAADGERFRVELFGPYAGDITDES